MLSWEYIPTSWSARISNSLHVASSEPVANAWPLGKYYNNNTSKTITSNYYQSINQASYSQLLPQGAMKGMNKEKVNIRLSYFTFSARTGTGANYTAMGIEVTARAYGNYDVKYYATVKTDFLKSPAWNHAGGAWSWSELILPYKPSLLWLYS